MGEDPGPTLPPAASDNAARRHLLSYGQPTQPQPAQPQVTQPGQPAPGRHAARRHPPPEAPPYQAPAYQASPSQAAPSQAAPSQASPSQAPTSQAPTYYASPYQVPVYQPQGYHELEPGEVLRYGPGVPTKPRSQPSLTAEALWRTGRLPPPSGRRVRLRRLLGTALTVILLAASGAILYFRFHHAPFQVSGVSVSQQSATACGLDVTGMIVTNGAAGTISYQWVFRPGHRTPQPLSQSVLAGQRDVYVTVAVQGQGHGSAFQTVTLQVLGPNPQSASMGVIIRC
jgi:hypothetical protein